MKPAQQTFTLQSDFSQLKMTGEAATTPLYLDLAIYDLMADGRKRSVNEVVSALAVLGYKRDDVNRRMVVMLHKRNMFTQAHGGKSKVLYELKKGAKRPDFTNDTKPVIKVKESEIVLQPTRAAVPITYRKRRTIDTSETIMQPQDNQPQQMPTNPLFVAGEPEPTAVHWSEPKQAKVFVVEPNDPVRVALWKTMMDHAWYKSADLVTLLADFYPSDIVRYHLRFMVKRDMVAVDKSNYQEFQYRLNDDVPMPEGLEPYKPNIPLETPTPQPQLPLNQEPEMQTKTEYAIQSKVFQKNTDFPVGADPQTAPDTPVGEFVNPNETPIPTPSNLPDLVEAASEDKPKEVPLVEVGGITIKGQRFSYKEARKLLAELRKQNLGYRMAVADGVPGKYVTVVRTILINGEPFSVHQANDITLSLIDELE